MVDHPARTMVDSRTSVFFEPRERRQTRDTLSKPRLDTTRELLHGRFQDVLGYNRRLCFGQIE